MEDCVKNKKHAKIWNGVSYTIVCILLFLLIATVVLIMCLKDDRIYEKSPSPQEPSLPSN